MKLNKKNKLLITSLIVSLYICYNFAVAKTIVYYRQVKENTDLLASNNNTTGMLQQLVTKEKELNSLLGQYATAGTISYQNELLRKLTVLSRQNSLRIIDFQEPHTIQEKDMEISSYVFSLEGNFNGILLLINSLENNPSYGIVKHSGFIKKRNYKTNTDYLTAQVILQKNETKKS